MDFDDRWLLAEAAAQRCRQVRHRLAERFDPDLTVELRHRVDRTRFRRLADRIGDTGTPYGVQAVIYRPDGALLLARDAVADRWVPPGGLPEDDESLEAALRREVDEEVGVGVEIQGLAILARVDVVGESNETTGVLPLFRCRATDRTPSVDDPDGDVTDARWFDQLPADTRDRDVLRRWRQTAFDRRSVGRTRSN